MTGKEMEPIKKLGEESCFNEMLKFLMTNLHCKEDAEYMLLILKRAAQHISSLSAGVYGYLAGCVNADSEKMFGNLQ